MYNLRDKIIIVTGGSGLIGQHIVSHITSAKGFVVNADISVSTSENLSTYHCDITSEEHVHQLIKDVTAKYGKIDGLVNNAYPRTKDWGLKFEDIPYSSWKKNIDLQLNSQFLFCQAALAQMKVQGFGSIINMASIYGVVGPTFSVYDESEITMPAAYAAIKGGIINFTRYLASYFGKHNIRVNSISPGGIFDNQNPTFVQNYESIVPLKRMGQPSDISGSVAFLLSDEARYITGHNLIIDGGWTAI